MPLTILSGTQLRSLLLSLSHDEIVNIQQNLAYALRDYSVGNQETGCAATFQPRRTAITQKNGRTTLFMPASTRHTVGIKVISLQDGGSSPGCEVLDSATATTTAASSSSSSSQRGLGARASSSSSSTAAKTAARNSIASLSSEMSELSVSSQEDNGSTSNNNSNDNDDSITTSSKASLTSGCVNQLPIDSSLSKTLGAWPGAGSRDTSPHGSLTLLDENSLPFGLINAHELTPFRTALASTMILNKRKRVRTLVIFGAGKQAYWHIRLSLVLRGEDIKRVYIVNRSFERAAELLRDIYSPENSSWRGNVKFSAVSSDFVEYERILHAAILKADAIFCCTPSLEPLFPARLLTSREGRQKGRLISAIGSYKSHMAELDPDILREEVDVQPPHRHFHKHIQRSGVVVVDNLDGAMKEAGEIIQAGIKPQQVVELGELLMVRQTTQEMMKDAVMDDDDSKSLRQWVEKGNVIYKSVGLGLMDLVTGGDLVQLARARKIGTTVDDF